MTPSTAPHSLTLYDIIPPPRAPLTPSLGFWLLLCILIGILAILMKKKQRSTAPSFSSLLGGLLRETKSADEDFIIENASRISRILRRAGSDLCGRDLTALSAIELQSILDAQDDNNEDEVSLARREFISLLIGLEQLKFAPRERPHEQDMEVLTRSLAHVLATLSKSRRSL